MWSVCLRAENALNISKHTQTQIYRNGRISSILGVKKKCDIRLQTCLISRPLNQALKVQGRPRFLEILKSLGSVLKISDTISMVKW